MPSGDIFEYIEPDCLFQRNMTPEEAFQPFSCIAPYPFEDFRDSTLLQPSLHVLSLVIAHSCFIAQHMIERRLFEGMARWDVRRVSEEQTRDWAVDSYRRTHLASQPTSPLTLTLDARLCAVGRVAGAAQGD